MGPDFQTPAGPAAPGYAPTPLPAQTSSASGLAGDAQRFGVGQAIPLEWWALFHSPEIDRLVRDALAHSPTLAAAQANLRVARETYSAQYSSLLLPNANAQLQGARERVSGITYGLSGGGVDGTAFIASLNATYNVDLFGAARRAVEGYSAQIDVANYELQAAYLTLTSAVVQSAIAQASLRAQLQATNEVLAAEQHELDLVERQFKLGAINQAILLSQKTQVETTRAQIPALEKAIAQNRDQLAMLTGRLPSDADLPIVTIASISLPQEVPVSLPSELVRQRPDILTSEAQLHVASAQVGVATAALYPTLGITAQYGRESLGFRELSNPGNTIWSIGAGLTQPLFFNGQLTAQKRAAIAAYDQAQAQYQSTVLQAFQSVADALRAIEGDATSLEAIAGVDALAKKSLDLAQTQYRLGAVSTLVLLDAERQYAQAHLNLVGAQASRFSDTATLFQALGGGWWQRGTALPEVALPAVAGAQVSQSNQ